MPSISEEMQSYYISRVRMTMVLKPDVSLREIQKALAESDAPLILDIKYISKVRDKIIRERAHRNNGLIATRLAQIQDKKALIERQLWKEAMNNFNEGSTRVKALDTLFKMDLELLKSEMDAGIYDRKLGTLQVNTHTTVNIEQKALILNAFQNFGFVMPEQNAGAIIEPHNSSLSPAQPINGIIGKPTVPQANG